MRSAILFGVAALALAACEDHTPTPINTPGPTRTGSPAAEKICVDYVNQKYGKSVGTVQSSQVSTAGTGVMVAAEGETYRCLVTTTGTLQEFAAQP